MFHGVAGRAYMLGAESQDAMEQWMKALACASYDYMKLMVAELQRQLDELEGQFNLTSLALCLMQDIYIYYKYVNMYNFYGQAGMSLAHIGSQKGSIY